VNALARTFALASALLVAVPLRAGADPATAAAAFKQADELRKQGKWADACPLFEASYNADPQLGVLLHLADCHEHVGRTATAWAEFNDAVGLAHAKNDPREAAARKRADALTPKLAKLRIAAPKTVVSGLVVRRGTVDITALVGGEIPLDPGEHEIVASAPGFTEWRQKVTVQPGAVADLQIPALEKVVVKPVETVPEVHEGTLKITSAPGSQILIDNDVVGTGTYEGKLKSGGHTLRIVAGGMRPYQSEVFIGDNEARTIDVPLEKDVVAGPVVVQAPPDIHPAFELAVDAGLGVKARADNPLVALARAEAAFRFGKRVNFGIYAEYGSIDTSGRCGFDMPGPTPMTPYDFGPRTQFKSCWYVMPGLQLLIHILPENKIDPYIGLSPGFRFGFAEWTEYNGGAPQGTRSDFFPAIVATIRAGVDYHGNGTPKGWRVGGFIDTAFTVIGDEASDQYSKSPTFAWVTIFAGVRTGTAF
jgi:hypothetical protein